MEKLVLKQVSCVYDGNIPALEDISFSLKSGESVCVAGANGSGKSTLLQIIASCVKSGGGEIIIDGRRVPSGVHHGKAGIVFQEPDNQFFMPTIWEDVAFGIMKKGMGLAEAKAAALAALAQVEAEKLAERRPYTLSGGEKQRAALASILIMKPEILLLDEPTAALDPRSRKNIISLIKNLPCAKLIASHDLDMALDLADRIIFLHRGKIAADCPSPGLLLDKNFLRSIGLELPLRVSAEYPGGA
ncbi:MAG: energy-coupling factor ABC transporter ATP-binding protein [Treponema sp.]|jgi:cobalt/nickel transport system ATP-binding protein|nr:energy-coupling factor ABC transporter ATP-binding protein [Treponema sp.]